MAMDQDKLWYICTICCQSFEEAARLQTHRKLVHPASDTKLVLLLTQQELTPFIRLKRCRVPVYKNEIRPAPNCIAVPAPGGLPTPPVKLEGHTITASASTTSTETENGSSAPKVLKTSPNSVHPHSEFLLLETGSNSEPSNSVANSAVTSTNDPISDSGTSTAPTSTQAQASLELKPEILTGSGSTCTPVILGAGTIPDPSTLADGKIRCRICFQEFRAKSSLNTHFLLKHVPKETPTADNQSASSSSVVKPDPEQSPFIQQSTASASAFAGSSPRSKQVAKRKKTHGEEEQKKSKKVKSATVAHVQVVLDNQSESPTIKNRKDKDEEQFLQKEVHASSPQKKRKGEHTDNDPKRLRSESPPPLIWVRSVADLLEPEEPEPGQPAESHSPQRPFQESVKVEQLEINGSAGAGAQPGLSKCPPVSDPSASPASVPGLARSHTANTSSHQNTFLTPTLTLHQVDHHHQTNSQSPATATAADFRLRDILATLRTRASTGYFSAAREPSRVCEASSASAEGLEIPSSNDNDAGAGGGTRSKRRRERDDTIDEEADKLPFPAHKLSCQYCQSRVLDFDTLAQLDEHISQGHDDSYCHVCLEDLSLPAGAGGSGAVASASSARIENTQNTSKKCGTCRAVVFADDGFADFIQKRQNHLLLMFTEERERAAHAACSRCSCDDLNLYSHAELEEAQQQKKTTAAAAGAGAPLEIKCLKERFCEPCKLHFSSTFDYRNHFMAAHALPKEWICDICLRHFKSQGGMLEHQKHALGHTKYQPFQCGTCRLVKHVCGSCHREFGGATALEAHQATKKGNCYKGRAGRAATGLAAAAAAAAASGYQFAQPAQRAQPHPQPPKNNRKGGKGRALPHRAAAVAAAEASATAASALRCVRLQRRSHQRVQPQQQQQQRQQPQLFRCNKCPPNAPPFHSAAELEVHRLTCIAGSGPKCSYCGLEFEWIYEQRQHEKFCSYHQYQRGGRQQHEHEHMVVWGGGGGGVAVAGRWPAT